MLGLDELGVEVADDDTDLSYEPTDFGHDFSQQPGEFGCTNTISFG